MFLPDNDRCKDNNENKDGYRDIFIVIMTLS